MWTDAPEHDACGIGFLADLSHRPSHDTVRLALAAVGAMVHRGARAADGRTGDGSGILLETPRSLYLRELTAAHVRVPERHLAALCLFLPRDGEEAASLRARVEAAVRAAELAPLRWRVPVVDRDVLGETARRSAPSYEQLLVDLGPGNARERMRVARRLVLRALRDEGDGATLVSASPTSVVYKALLSSSELGSYYADLRDPSVTTRFAVFHQRFSTNSAPAWRLVQPFTYLAHNGEIDTIAGNRQWMKARGIEPPRRASDSLAFDVALDAMLGSGYRIDEAVDLMLSPSIDPSDARLRAYYDAHVPTVEPWDGPAAMVFADADVVGAALDRVGFRPLRWCRTASGKVLAASEAGVVDFGDDPIVRRGRLGPGERLVVRFATGELVEPEAFRAERRGPADFRHVVASWGVDLPEGAPAGVDPAALERDLLRFGYTKDERTSILAVLGTGGEPTSSMGDDGALAFLSRRLPVAEYLRQRFAQVTNPPIDALREGFVFDTRAWVGSGPTNGDVPAYGSIVVVDEAILDETAFDALRFDARLVQRRIALDLGDGRLETRIARIADEAERAVREGASFIVLDDRDAGVIVPGLLAAGAVHARLIECGLRMQASIALADGGLRDAHGLAAAIAAGANVVTPWLALRAIDAEGEGARARALAALRMGLIKILAKVGICTLRSYVGAQLFETVGLGRDVAEMCFPQARAHVPTVGFRDLEDDVRAWAAAARDGGALHDRGLFRFRRDGVRRMFDPTVLKTLRAATLNGDEEAYRKLSDALEGRAPVAVRDLVEVLPIGEPVPLDEVEPEERILARFVTSAMSLGALSPEAHAAIAKGAELAGARSNSGEGGEDPSRYPRTPGIGRSHVKQVASARFGVTAAYLASADEIEIKIAQGAKPGEGGQIPGNKVTAEIAALRGAAPGQSLVSPPPHHDIYSIEDLAELIYDLRRAAPQARIAVKLVAQSGIGYVASGVAKARADVVHVSGHSGGTGASPLGSIFHAGLPWELGLVETQHALLAAGLRSRVRLRVDGGFATGRDVVVAAMLGADEFGFGTALLLAIGCIYARQCHKNTCPVGIATQDAALRAKFAGTDEEAARFLRYVARDVRRRLAALGARSLDELRGRSDLLRPRSGEGLDADLSEVLRLPETPAERDRPFLDDAHVDDLAGEGAVVRLSPADRAVGARLAHARVVAASAGTPLAASLRRYVGSAGQSFGAFLTSGLTLELDGEANDYVGKSMDGGTIVVRGPGHAREPAVGNACAYGARGGRLFVRGMAGERLAVRNSGATVVVEGAGAHACEYMTAGLVAILGPTGRNVAAGMTGGEAFLLDDPESVARRAGPTPLVARRLTAAEPAAARLRDALERYARETDAESARDLLADWPASAGRFTVLAPDAPAVAVTEFRTTAVSSRS